VIPSECRPIDLPRIDPQAGFPRSELEPTFRDPAGQLLLTEKYALRRVRPAAAGEALRFLGSPLRQSLERSRDLVSSETVDAEADSSAVPGEIWLRHPRIDPISYPWEWTPAQWRAAAELTLRVAGNAIDAGWTLKDATPLNVLFAGARPVFVDVLSFERRDPRSSVWLAYGQFVRTFLLPLVALKYLSWPLQATLFSRDGYEPSALFRALPKWRRLNPDLLDVVTLAALFEGKGGGSQKPKPSTSDPELARHILHKRLARLGKQIRHAAEEDVKSQWSNYEQRANHYQPADVEQKQQFVRSALERCRPARVLDIGANTGTYSLIAAQAGAEVVALDSDTAALEALWRAAAGQHMPVTPLVANIARPTPAAGWRNREHLSLLDRLIGKFDLVLMLAVIHHLILREQLPLEHIGGLCAQLSRRWLVLEWVPPSDPMFQGWLRGRGDLYGHLSEEDLNRAFAPFFHVADRAELGNGRILLLFERHITGEPPAGADTPGADTQC
jgi:SAM-dependent methyltransferase